MSHGYCSIHTNMSYIRRVGRYYPFVSNRISIQNYLMIDDFTISTCLSPSSAIDNIDNLYINTEYVNMLYHDSLPSYKLSIGSFYAINQVLLVEDDIHTPCTLDLISINPTITNTYYSIGYYLNSATEMIDQLNIQTGITFTQ